MLALSSEAWWLMSRAELTETRSATYRDFVGHGVLLGASRHLNHPRGS